MCGFLVEFNRISVEVLSVVAVQVKSVQDAIRDKKDIFNFMGEMIKCVPTVGIFITMNPVCIPERNKGKIIEKKKPNATSWC